MLTRMTEEVWVAVLKLFRACRSRRGDKGRNDRKFLEALDDFTLHSVTRRALPSGFSPWSSVRRDLLGRPTVIHLTPGNASDVKAAPDGLASALGRFKRLIAGRGYDANHLRRDLTAARTTPVIPSRCCRKRPIGHDQRCCRDRWGTEAAFCRLQGFRRLATRYDKLAANFASAVARRRGCVLVLIKHRRQADRSG